MQSACLCHNRIYTMHFRRLACLLIGIWFGGTLAVGVGASYRYRVAERILSHPAPGSLEHIDALGSRGARDFLIYAAAEQMRDLRETWDSIQVGLGALLFLLLLFGSNEGKFGLLLALGMLALAIFDRLILTPEISLMARLADLTGARAGERARRFLLEGGYIGLEAAKWMLGLGLATHLVIRHHHSGMKQKAPEAGLLQ